MKKILNVLCMLLAVASIVVGCFLYDTVKVKNSIDYSFSELSVKDTIESDNDKKKTDEELKKINVIDIDLPYIETTMESTDDNCSNIGISIFQQYQIEKLKKDSIDLDIENLQYEKNNIIKGDLNDFIIELTFNTRNLEGNSKLISQYANSNGSKVYFRTRLHVKAIKPMEYKMVAIGKELGKDGE